MRSFNSETSLKKQISLFLDNELTSEDQQDFIRRVETDPRGPKMLESEKNFRDFVRNNVKRPSVKPDFIQNLKDRIRS